MCLLTAAVLRKRYAFKVEGSTLAGTVTGQHGDTTITDGKVDGDRISFSVTRTLAYRI